MSTYAKYRVEPGQRFGRGVVIDNRVRITTRSQPRGYPGARMQCDCGNQYTSRPDRIISGHVQSCGCLQKEKAAQSGRQNRTHGLSHHLLYDTWKNVIDRCENPKFRQYKDYGGRGIAICEQWHDLKIFITDIERLIGTRPSGTTLDRVNNDGNYEPGNVRWATRVEQRANSRHR